MIITKINLFDSILKKDTNDFFPELILDFFKKNSINESGKILNPALIEFNEIKISGLDNSNLEENLHLIFQSSKELFEKHKKIFFIGGEHIISYPILKAFRKIEKSPLLIVFDSHFDCIFEDKICSRNWLRKLFDSGFDFNNVILISSRVFNDDEIKFVKKNSITWVKMDVLQEDLREVCDLVMERARNSSGFYISVDIDSIDPAFAPGTFLNEPGGISSRDIVYFIKRLSLLDNLRGGDIVNIRKDLDLNNLTQKLGAKILSEMV